MRTLHYWFFFHWDSEIFHSFSLSLHIKFFCNTSSAIQLSFWFTSEFFITQKLWQSFVLHRIKTVGEKFIPFFCRKSAKHFISLRKWSCIFENSIFKSTVKYTWLTGISTIRSNSNLQFNSQVVFKKISIWVSTKSFYKFPFLRLNLNHKVYWIVCQINIRKLYRNYWIAHWLIFRKLKARLLEIRTVCTFPIPLRILKRKFKKHRVMLI